MGYRNYGPANGFVVSKDGTGDFTTIATALTAAASGTTIFIKPGTYTENLTLVAGVNLTAFGSDSSLNATGVVQITGKCTFTAAGSVTISGIQLNTNSDFFLAVTGSSASVVNLQNCYLNCSNNTGISYTSSSTSSGIKISNCWGNIGTTGIALFTATGGGTSFLNGSGMIISNTTIGNSGGTTTSSTTSNCLITFIKCKFYSPFTSSSVGVFGFYHTDVECQNQNTTAVTTAGTGSHYAEFSEFTSGSASAISIGTGTTFNIYNCVIASTNTNAITGAGTIGYGNITFSSSSSIINTTTQTQFYTNLGKWKASGQPCFMAYCNSSSSNNTGDGTDYTNLFQTVRFDLASNFTSNTTFTAPVTGKYQFNISVLMQNLNTSHLPLIALVTSAITYKFGNNGSAFAGNNVFVGSVVADMTAGDTALVHSIVSNSTKTVGIYGNAGDPRTCFSGFLIA